MHSRKGLYQQILRNYLRAHLPEDVGTNDVVLIQINDVYVQRVGGISDVSDTRNGTWRHVLQPHIHFHCDIQKNVSDEDIRGICGFFVDITPEINELRGICKTHRSCIMVIANVRGYRMTTDVFDVSNVNDERWQRCNNNMVFLINHSETVRNT